MTEDTNTIALTAEIVAAFAASASGKSMKADELPALIHSVHSALSTAGQPTTPAEPDTPKATPSQIRKSISPEALISFIDGKPYKSLRRHLTTAGTMPEEYKARYGLPKNYPILSPNYSAQRSELAKKLGLGNKRAPAPEPTAAKRGRRKSTDQAT